MSQLDTTLQDSLFVEIINDYQAAKNIETLLRLGVKNAERLGFYKLSYHHLPPIGNFYGQRNPLYHAHNIPKASQQTYDKIYGQRFDPLMQYSLETGTPIWISEGLKLIKFKDSMEEHMVRKMLEEHGDGLSIPLFGPKLRPGYCCVMFGDNSQELCEFTKWIAATTASVFHTRYCTLMTAMAEKINLTLREMEVLDLLTLGKNNPEIAIILNISKHTVNSYVKNLFMKFGTTDRVSTAVKAYQLEVEI